MRSLLMLSLISSSLYAADDLPTQLKDIRLGVVTGLDYYQELHPQGSSNNYVEMKANLIGLRLSYIQNVTPLTNYGCLFLGGNVSWDQIESYKRLSPTYSIDTKSKIMGFSAQVGYAYFCPSNPKAHSELALDLGYYVAKEQRVVTGFPSVPSSLSGHGYGLRLGSYYQLSNNNVQLGLELMYVIDRELDGALNSATFGNIDENHRGWLLGLTLGMRL